MPDTRLIAEIDLRAIVRNWRCLAGMSGEAETAAVVKADAYGHGAEAIAATLYTAGCRVFFTSNADEAIQIRPHVGDSVIGYFDGLFAGDIEAIREGRLIPSVNDFAQLGLLPRLAVNDEPPRAMLQIDTGMNRLGLDWRLCDEECCATLMAAADWRLVYSHLASADDENSPQSEEQRQRFDRIARHFPAIPTSLAASAGILKGKSYHYRLTRPGIAIYGYPPIPAEGFTPALTLKGRVLQLRDARKGDTIGYNATHKLKRDSRLATIAGGYADGVRRQLGDTGFVTFKEKKAPILGRVSMDTIIVDITDWPQDCVSPRDYLTIIDPRHDANAMATLSQTICYDILTSLGLRATRNHI